MNSSPFLVEFIFQCKQVLPCCVPSGGSVAPCGRSFAFLASLRSVSKLVQTERLLCGAPLPPAHSFLRFARSLVPPVAPLRVLCAWRFVAPLRFVNSPTLVIMHSSLRPQVAALRCASLLQPGSCVPHSRLLCVAFAQNSHWLFLHKINPPPLVFMRPCAALRLREQPPILFVPCRGQMGVVRLCLNRLPLPAVVYGQRFKHVHRLRCSFVALPPFHLAQGAGGARLLKPRYYYPVIMTCPAGGLLIFQRGTFPVKICALFRGRCGPFGAF